VNSQLMVVTYLSCVCRLSGKKGRLFSNEGALLFVEILRELQRAVTDKSPLEMLRPAIKKFALPREEP
jgi:hypothetical protein